MPTTSATALRQPPDGQASSINQPHSTGKCPLQPWGVSMSQPKPYLYSFCLSTSMGSGRGRSGWHCLQSCKLGRGMSLLGKLHTPCCYPGRGCTMVQTIMGQALPPFHGIAHHFGLLAHQPAVVWSCCSRLVPFCQGSQPMLQIPVADFLSLKAA